MLSFINLGKVPGTCLQTLSLGLAGPCLDEEHFFLNMFYFQYKLEKG